MVFSLIPVAEGEAEEKEDREGRKQQIAALLAPLAGDRSAVIVALQKVQGEFGYIPPEAFHQIARWLGVSPSEVYGAATFYAQFYLTPRAAYQIRACRGTACHVRGGPRVLEAIKRTLGIEEGETTPDLKYSLETVACIGACALAPNIVINEDTYGRMSSKKAMELLEKG